MNLKTTKLVIDFLLFKNVVQDTRENEMKIFIKLHNQLIIGI